MGSLLSSGERIGRASLQAAANRAAWVLVAFVSLPPQVDAATAAAEAVELDTASAWFKPVLVENRSTVCAAVLEEANRLFHSRIARLDIVPIQVKGMAAIDPDEAFALEQRTELHPNTGEPRAGTQAFVTTHGRKIYVSVRTNPGCGGGCETRQMFASAQPFEHPMHWNEDPALSKPTPAAPVFTLLKSQDDVYHVAVVADEQLQLFTLTENAAWDSVCRVSIQPNLHAEEDDELQSALQSIHALSATIAAIRQGAGSCGSLRAHDRGRMFMDDAFERALYRPWARQGPWESPPASGDRRSAALTAWSLIGLHEYAALAEFRSQLPVTSGQLARFYASKFGWSNDVSQRAAGRSVAAAVDVAFVFSSGSTTTDGSLGVRQAVLENKSVAELEALTWRPAPLEGGWRQWNESVLSIAVKHPAALRWLLTKKLDPNHANAFGKTPLMYAAQHNALEAVQILLTQGADPNAATLWPEDTCTYTLTRANVTALHYAARYGSAEVLEALIAGGALTFVRTDQRGDSPGQTPLDWLRTHASPTASERNPNIAAADFARLEQLLSPPEGRRLLEYSQRQTLQSQKQYAAGDMHAARRSLKNALQANPANPRALSDMSLLALRAGQYGEALEAATRLIETGDDARMIANAWFNVGLACERSGQRYLSFNGENYCMSSRVFPFLQSWLATNSRVRAEKLEQLFAEPGSERCAVSQPDSTEHRYIFVRASDMSDNRIARIQRIYVLHPAGSTISASQIHWQVRGYTDHESLPRLVTPRMVGSHRLGRSAITVLESEDEARPPVMIADYKCF